MASLDWSQCPAVESVPGKVSGAWVYKNTRMPVSIVFENLASGASIKDLIEWFGVTQEQVVEVLEFAARSLEDAPGMTPQIDKAFILKWDPRYEEGDEDEYRRLVNKVGEERKASGTISKETFLAIWAWKGANRVKRHLAIEEYETRYAKAFGDAALAPPEHKLALLVGPIAKLPGLGAPTGSTIIHFMFPETMPIIDVRTAEVLFKAGLIDTKRREIDSYEDFRKAIDEIRRGCPNFTLRQVDRALFAYHKEVLAAGRPSKSKPAISAN
jgi:uncharacterized protein (DUF433 family)